MPDGRLERCRSQYDSPKPNVDALFLNLLLSAQEIVHDPNTPWIFHAHLADDVRALEAALGDKETVAQAIMRLTGGI